MLIILRRSCFRFKNSGNPLSVLPVKIAAGGNELFITPGLL